MTLAQLEENLKTLKIDDKYCNLLSKYHSTPEKIREIGLYVAKNGDMWEAYYTERGSSELTCRFSSESDAYEYVHCYFKKSSDCERLLGGFMSQYPQELIKKMESCKIPGSEYSFDGGMAQDCLCTGRQGDAWEVYYSDGVKKLRRGVFYRQDAAYDFLFYLVMKKHVSVKRRWW